MDFIFSPFPDGKEKAQSRFILFILSDFFFVLTEGISVIRRFRDTCWKVPRNQGLRGGHPRVRQKPGFRSDL